MLLIEKEILIGEEFLFKFQIVRKSCLKQA